MNRITVLTSILIAVAFARLAVVNAEATIPHKLSCLVGESVMTDADYAMEKIAKKQDFFSRIATQAIKQILDTKPYDQQGTEFNISLFDQLPKLTGFIVIKESYQQIDLDNAKCEKAVGNLNGFNLFCIIKNPIDNQSIFLNYLYKYNDKAGILELKVSKSKTGLLTKNIFVCSHK